MAVLEGKGNLTTLHIGSLEADNDQQFQSYVVARSCLTLRHLHLGCQTIASRGGLTFAQPDIVTERLFDLIEQELTDKGNEQRFSMLLETLSLNGMSFNRIVQGVTRSVIDFSGLVTLVLESCCDITEAFTTLRQETQDSSSKQVTNSLTSLKNFTLRHERSDVPFQNAFEVFLCSLPPLEKLHILLEGGLKRLELESILNVHGKSLQSLIWDETRGPRISPDHDQILVRGGTGHLGVISRLCPSLISLGIALDWDKVAKCPVTRNKVPVMSIPVSFLVLTLCRSRPGSGS